MKSVICRHSRFTSLVSQLQSPLLLFIRLYWGWQFMQTGWGKLHNLDRVAAFFSSLNIPFPSANAHLVAGLGSRLISLLLAGNILVAYWTADHAALTSIFSDPARSYVADPCTFLFASLLILVFGAGLLTLDALLAWRRMPSSALPILSSAS